MQITTQLRKSYSNYSYYDIERIADDNWNDFPLLLELHSNALKTRKTPYAKELKAKLEERLKQIIFNYRRSRSILKEMQLYLFQEGTEFAEVLIFEIDKRLGESNQANQLKPSKTKNQLRPLKNKIRLKTPESFPWVSTEVGFGFEKLDTSGWKKNDLLSKLGYKTGQYSDCDFKTRRNILYKAFEEDIPKKIAILFEDIESWGKRKSAKRLRKIAESIALVVRSEKMHSYDYRISISERESDLADLKKRYYDGKYDK